MKIHRRSLEKEQVVYFSKRSFFWYLCYSWLSFCTLLVNAFICLEIGFCSFPIEIIFASLGLFLINLCFNYLDSGKFVITDKNLKIIRTFFFTKVVSFPLNGMQDCRIEESYRFKSVQSYLIKIKFGGVLKNFVFFEISNESIKRIQKIECYGNTIIATDNIEQYYIISRFFLFNIIHILFFVYFFILYFVYK